ncbi:angiopoietin-1-like [Branchiostoma floridae]|uniref:Angiopoietin-1-like n=1 Tax=Branchiostoma floridae TaxID=7739 RepID=A0A9J7L2G3_BRAFL|nr:angiopoietin-1-like [Branchiostoma floridae]XP_035674683.1 angiopoietin-1-like [Branchiostoma floridae]
MVSRVLLVAACLMPALVGVLGRGDIADGERYGKLPPPQYYLRREAESTAREPDLETPLPTETLTTPEDQEQPTLPAAPERSTPSEFTSTVSTPEGRSSSPEVSTEAMMYEVVNTSSSTDVTDAPLTGKEDIPAENGKVSASTSLGTDAETSHASNIAEVDADKGVPNEAWGSNPESEVKTDELPIGFVDFLAKDDPEPLRPNKTDGGLDMFTKDIFKWSDDNIEDEQKLHHDKTATHGEAILGAKASKYGEPYVYKGDSSQDPTIPKKPEKHNVSDASVAEDDKPMTNMFNTYNTFNLKIPTDEEGQEFLNGFNEHFSHFRLALEGIAANHTENLAKLVERIETLESHSWELELELGDVRAENMQLKQQLEELRLECRDRNAKLEERTCQTGNDTLRLKEELEEVKLRWVENVTRMEEECFRVTHNVSDVMFDMENRIREETNKNMSEVQDNIAWGCLAVQGECRTRMDNLTQEVRKVTDTNRVEQLTQADASTIFFPAFTPANARDCSELFRKGVWQSGVYRIQPDIVEGGPVIEAFCDMDTESGGWTVIQRRPDWMGPLRFFNKNWTEYSSGFGDVRGEHWLGNEALHHLTSARENVLRIDMRSASTRWHASYSSFNVDEKDTDFRLSLSDFHGNAGDALTQDGKIDHVPFTTADRDNDACADCNCAADLHGGWWYQTCEAGLNGEHGGVNYGWNSREISLYPEFVEMKTRPKEFDKLVALSDLMAKDNHFVEDSFETKEDIKFVE